MSQPRLWMGSREGCANPQNLQSLPHNSALAGGITVAIVDAQVIRFLAVNPPEKCCVKVLRPGSGLSQSVASEVLCARAAMLRTPLPCNQAETACP